MNLDLLKGNLLKTLISFSLPLIFSGLLQQLYTLADAFIVGNAEGQNALAAVGASGAITTFFVLAITGFTSGLSILSAQRFGHGDREIQRKIISTFLILLCVTFSVLALLAICLSRTLLQYLHTPDDILHEASLYLKFVLPGIPFLTVYNVYAAVLRGFGDSRTPFFAVLLSAAGNIILDLILVVGCHCGIRGAAIATAVSQFLMAVFILFYTHRKHPALQLSLSARLFDRAVCKAGCALALPIAVQSLVSSVGKLILQNFMNGFGTTTVAAITTAYRIDELIMLPIINLGTGIATVTAQSVGAKDFSRSRKCLRVGLAMSLAVSVCLTSFVLFFGGKLIGLFGVTEEAIHIGSNFFASIAWFYVIFSFTMAMRGYVEGRGGAIFSGTFAVLTLIVRITLSYALRPFFDNMVIAYAEACSWCFSLLLYVVCIALIHRKDHQLRL